MTEQQQPATASASTPPAPHAFNALAYEPLMTRIKAAQLKPLFTGLLAALGVMALANVVMFALVQQAQQETVEFATKVAANAEAGGEFQEGGETTAERMAPFTPLADMIDSIKAKERRRDALLTQHPEFAGNLPSANAPDWRALAAQALRAYDDQIDNQIALLTKNADVASAASIAPSSLDLAGPALALSVPAPVKGAAAKPVAAKRSAPQNSAAIRTSDSGYARELTAALNRSVRDQVSAPSNAAPAPSTPVATAPPVVLETAPIATASPIAPPAATPASDELVQ